MRICANVEVSNRNLPPLNLGNRRPTRSFITIGFMPGKSETPFILHQTQQNFIGVKYEVKGNIKAIFTRFIDEGKTTIRFFKPPHDLIIKSSPVDLKPFLNLLKSILIGNSNKDSIKKKLSNLCAATKKVPSKPKTSVVILSKNEYPTLEGFPRTTIFLQVNNVGMKKLDSRILRLQGLKSLNLSKNSLETLPKHLLDLLPTLSELRLAGNTLGHSNDWSWLSGSSCEFLTLLDLSDNQVALFPKNIIRLRNLKDLLINTNYIKTIPNVLCQMRLKTLHISQNKLQWLPSNILQSKLESLDISGNPGTLYNYNLQPPTSLITPQSLLDLSASILVTIRYGPFCDENCPRTLIEYLEQGGICGGCRRGIFPPPSVPHYLKEVSPNDIAISSTFGPNSVPVAFIFCSSNCFHAHVRI